MKRGIKTIGGAALAIGMACWLPSCAKISDFGDPSLHEIFMGSLAITPILKGFYAAGRATGAVTVVGNPSGQTVSIFGLPKNDPFELLPQTQFGVPPPTVSGLEAEVVDKGTLRIVGFSSVGGSAMDWKLEVRGTIVRQGPRLSTHPDEPIVISATIGDLRNAIPESMLKKITRISDGVQIEDLEDSVVVDMYQINFTGQITSIF